MTSNSFLDKQRDAALEQVRTQAEEWRRISDLVLGTNTLRCRVEEVVSFFGDYLVQVADRDRRPTWTTVVGDKTDSRHYYEPELAMLHLIARRHDDNPNGSGDAAFYAARVLGVPEQTT